MLQGHRQVLHLPVVARGAGRLAQAHRLPADHDWRRTSSPKKPGFYKENPGTDVAVKQMIEQAADRQLASGIRLGNFVQIRTIIDEELEDVWGGKKTAKAGARRGRQARQRAAREVREGEQVSCMGAPRSDGAPSPRSR